MTKAMLVELKHVTPLRFTGADRLEFLHGQTSNDVKGLKVGEGNTSLRLNVKGHALAQMQVYRREEDLFVVVEDDAGGLVQGQLLAHIIFDQVEIQDLSDKLAVYSLQGEASLGVLQELFDLPEIRREFVQPVFANHKVLIAAHQRTAAGGFDLHVLRQDATALVEALKLAGVRQGTLEELEQARVIAAIPKAAYEAGEGILPQEAGLDFAVSYQKGCYLGQEIMARIEARGNVRRELVHVKMDQQPTQKDISTAERMIGRLGTVTATADQGYLGLAVVRKDRSSETVTIGDVVARIDKLP